MQGSFINFSVEVLDPGSVTEVLKLRGLIIVYYAISRERLQSASCEVTLCCIPLYLCLLQKACPF